MGEVDYSEFLNELLLRTAEHHQPAYGIFELTARCNLHCRMCYVNQPAGDPFYRHKELRAKQWLRLAKEAMDEGMLFLLLTGGEPLLHEDFFKILEPITRLGVLVSLFTNGTLITKDTAARLAQSPPYSLEITIYGASEKTCEAITRVPGSYARCLAGVENLLEYRLPLLLKTTITRQNVHELEDMRRLAQSYGLKFLAAWLLTRRRDGMSSDVDNCRLSPQECVILEATGQASATEWQETALRGSSPQEERNFYCLAGKCSFVIAPSGEMNTCVDLPFPSAQPLEKGFKSAWHEVQQFVETAPPLSPICQACQEKIFCPRCPAWSYLETQTLTDPVPYLCEIAREKRRIYGS